MKNEDQAWLDYRAKFANVYDESNYVSPLQSAIMDASHRLVGKRYQKGDHFAKVLEIGAGLNDDSFDRLIATHVLEHIYQPYLALKRMGASRKGRRNDFNTDPGIVWRIGRHLGSRKKAISQGIAYDFVMAREHVNTCNNVVTLIWHYFPERSESWGGLSRYPQ